MIWALFKVSCTKVLLEDCCSPPHELLDEAPCHGLVTGHFIQVMWNSEMTLARIKLLKLNLRGFEMKLGKSTFVQRVQTTMTFHILSSQVLSSQAGGAASFAMVWKMLSASWASSSKAKPDTWHRSVRENSVKGGETIRPSSSNKNKGCVPVSSSIFLKSNERKVWSEWISAV